MAFTPEDIAYHERLIQSYEDQVEIAAAQLKGIEARLRQLKMAIDAEKFILRQEGDN